MSERIVFGKIFNRLGLEAEALSEGSGIMALIA